MSEKIRNILKLIRKLYAFILKNTSVKLHKIHCVIWSRVTWSDSQDVLAVWKTDHRMAELDAERAIRTFHFRNDSSLIKIGGGYGEKCLDLKYIL